jgi:alginate O-acetyltransferase complex protein AlgI
MRPFRSFLLLLIILVCFAGLSYILPWNLHLPAVETLIPGDLVHRLSDLKKNNGSNPVLQPRDSLANSSPENSVSPDSLTALFPASFLNPLGKFCDSLRSSKGQVRVMYYGDSQIEGDRITSYLRYNLRKQGHGGTGPGLFLPVMPVSYTKSIYVRASSNWGKYNYLSFRNGKITHKILGPFMAFCRYLPEGQASTSESKAWIRIIPSIFADSASSQYDYLRIFYRNTQGPVQISVRPDQYPVLTDSLKVTDKTLEFICPLHKAKNILIEFSGRSSPDIYGMSIESKEGVIVDNIPQRGSAGLEFTMVNRDNLKESFKLLHPDLIVLHFGLNIVKNLSESYSYYEKGLCRQLSLLNEICPEGTQILLIGLTDMAYGDGDVVKPYPNIPVIINAQQQAAKNSNAIFWDAEKAMGGESSIIRWNGMDPPLAKKDYVHFTDQGADTLARLMMSDLFPGIKTGYRTAVSPVITDNSVPVAREQAASEQAVPDRNQSFLTTLVSDIFRYDQNKPFIFTAPAFWIFFLIVLAGYSLVYKRLFLRNLYLFLVSLFFYYKTGGLFLFILIFVTLIDYMCGLLIYKSERKGARKFFIILSIISNLGLLGYFKYTGLIVSTINRVFETNLKVVDVLSAFSNSILGTSFDISYIILPVGISFFTFQSLSYTIDVYRRKMEPVRNIIDFGFYVSFFPHLVAGPIVRASVFIPQIYQEFKLTHREFCHALFMISKGLVKKILISNFIALNLVDRVFDLPSVYSGFENLMAIYGYGLQIYCDFSGYTDIAIGVALILGFRLPVNFNSPYKAADIGDFWKRWHISLSQWLRDYLYISLGGNRKGKVRTCINLMITMLLGGLWHGASLRFIIWGGLHGIGLVIDKIRTFIFGPNTYKNKFVKALSIFLTFQFVSFCWVFFRANDIHSVMLMFRQIFQSFLPDSFNAVFTAYSSVFALIAAGYLIHFLPERLKESYRGLFIKIPLAGQVAIILIIGLLLYQMRTTDIIPFIYFRF